MGCGAGPCACTWIDVGPGVGPDERCACDNDTKGGRGTVASIAVDNPTDGEIEESGESGGERGSVSMCCSNEEVSNKCKGRSSEAYKNGNRYRGA